VAEAQGPRGRRLPSRVPTEPIAPVTPGPVVPPGAPRPEDMLGRGTVAPGAVPVAVRWWRAAQAAISAVLALLCAVLAWWWSVQDPSAWMAAPITQEAPASVAKQFTVDPSIKVRAAVRGPPPVPADAAIRLPAEVRLQRWSLECPGWGRPLAAVSGPIASGATWVRIPLVPPVACEVTLHSGSATPRKQIRAGETLYCTKGDSLQLLVCAHGGDFKE
jgi:hypothetical protein